MKQTIEQLKQLVFIGFHDKVDKAGIPYRYHIQYVINHSYEYALRHYDSQFAETVYVVALCHDVFEDLNHQQQIIIKNRIINDFENSEQILEALDIITRKPQQKYNDYIQQIKQSNNEIAWIVKMFDSLHNSDISRYSKDLQQNPQIKFTSKQYEKRYNKFKNLLSSANRT